MSAWLPAYLEWHLLRNYTGIQDNLRAKYVHMSGQKQRTHQCPLPPYPNDLGKGVTNHCQSKLSLGLIFNSELDLLSFTGAVKGV